jgi:hypothetical protein
VEAGPAEKKVRKILDVSHPDHPYIRDTLQADMRELFAEIDRLRASKTPPSAHTDNAEALEAFEDMAHYYMQHIGMFERIDTYTQSQEKVKLVRSALLRSAAPVDNAGALEIFNRLMNHATFDPEFAGRGFREAVQSVRSTILRGAGEKIPDGWKLVPINPTDLMIAEGDEGDEVDWLQTTAEDVWRKMLDVSPPPPTNEAEGG